MYWLEIKFNMNSISEQIKFNMNSISELLKI